MMNYSHISTFSLALGILLCVSALFADPPAKAEPRKTEEKETYEDGSLHFRVPLDLKGKRHGQFTAFFAGGKKMQERSHYEHGDRTGARELFDEKGNIIGDELWVHGKLALPKSMRLIEARRGQLLKEADAAVRALGKPGNANAPGSDALAHALARLNLYRYLADVPADVTLSDEEINLCQYAAEVLVKVGHLTHTPDRPSGMDETAFALGRKGCEHSNIFTWSNGADATVSVDAYMNDSDPSNIDRLGHRRWVLNPAMGKTGFGVSGNFSAMYSMDHSREEIPDYDFICFPPRGLCPSSAFSGKYAWHVTVNPRKYVVTESAELEICPVDGRLVRTSKPLSLDYKHIDRGPFGVGNAIIAHPESLTIAPGVVYEVVIHGVNTREDKKPVELSYYASFYNSSPGR